MDDHKLALYKKLVTKVCNARFGAVLKRFKDKTTGCQGKQVSDMAVRAELKATGKKVNVFSQFALLAEPGTACTSALRNNSTAK